jgi:class 3 adenylate cyclase/tetratricopeptide (TPR) repeat protein
MSGPSSNDDTVVGPHAEDEITSIERAITALEGQRAVLGDAVVETALAPLRQRREELETPASEQRRLVTVVFADLVGFTVLSRQLDPEDTREVVNAYFERWQEAIEEHGGVVEKFIGDAVMAVFGLRRSYEDDAHRAVRAALQIIDGLDELNAEIEPRYDVRLHLRVGIDTGEVVVSTLGERAGHEFVAVGPTVNRASRLQAAAPVDGVLISAETRSQIRGAFGMDEMPGLRLKGIDEPVDGWLVHDERKPQFNLESIGAELVTTPTVGRESQVRFLKDRLADVVEESRWRVVTVLGDAGVGKSRLLLDFDAWLAEIPENVRWFGGRASPTMQNTVNALLRDVLASRLGIQVDGDRELVRDRFTTAFTEALGPPGARAAALVGVWLGFDTDDGTHELPTDPQALRDQGTVALGEYFRAFADRDPVVVLLEDLHWADEGTLRWLDAVDPILRESRILVVATARPALLETRPRWGEGLTHHVRVDLPALSGRETRELLGHLLQRADDLPDGLVSMVVDAAEGNPFYIEELVTWLVDAGVVVKTEQGWLVVEELVGAVAVPPNLRGVLQSRLDALGAHERRLLQQASVIGRVFWDSALKRLAPELPDDALEALRQRKIIQQREVSRFASAREYLFKHALLRDVAYDGVLRAERERYHRGAALWLTETSAAVGRSEEYASVIAEHFERARDPQAATWYLRAGRRAVSVFALTEAGQLLEKAQDLAPSEDPDLRFDVLVELEALMDRFGERDRQTAQIEEMLALEEQIDPARRVVLLTIRGNRVFVKSDYDGTRRLAGQAVQAAKALGREDLRAEALLLQGKALTWADDTEAARACLDLAVASGREAERPLVVGEGLRYLGMLAGNVGDYPTSLEMTTQAREVFARAGDTEMESAALAQQATTLFNMARFAEAQAALEETLPIFRRGGHRYREAVALSNLASIAVMQGHFATSERYATEGIEICRELDELEAIAVSSLVLAHSALFTGRQERAKSCAEEAMAIARTVGNVALEADALTRLVHIALIEDEIDDAVEYGLLGVEVGQHASSDLDRAYTHLSVGYALRWAGRLDEADEHFALAYDLFEGLSLDALTRECTAARAWVIGYRGDVPEAVALLEPVLGHFSRDQMLGSCLPATMLRGCVEVLRLAGDDRATEVLEQARAYLYDTAREIGDPDLEAGYLAIAPNAALLADGGPVPA